MFKAIKLTGTKNSGIGFTFTSNGEGNSHKLTMKKKNEKSDDESAKQVNNMRKVVGGINV